MKKRVRIEFGDLQWMWDWRVKICSPFCDIYQGRHHRAYAIIIGPIAFSITLSWDKDDVIDILNRKEY